MEPIIVLAQRGLLVDLRGGPKPTRGGAAVPLPLLPPRVGRFAQPPRLSRTLVTRKLRNSASLPSRNAHTAELYALHSTMEHLITMVSD